MKEGAKMGRKNTLHKAIKAYILANPAASNSEIVEKTGASARTVSYVRSTLRSEGTNEPSKRSEAKSDGEELVIESVAEMLTPQTIKEMAVDPTFGADLLDEDQIRTKLLQQVQRMAFDPQIGSQTKLDAIQVWVKLKDIARAATMGPGNPLTEAEAVDRLSMIMQGCGPTVTIKALDRAFDKKGERDYEIERTPDASGTSETPNSP